MEDQSVADIPSTSDDDGKLPDADEDCSEVRLPCCLSWSVEEVGNWIESLGYPLYRECFTTNFITGRRLVLVSASALAKMGINDFEHIKIIAKAIRDLLQIEAVSWNRSVSLPPNEEKELFLEQKARRGKKADTLTFEKFHEDWEHLKFQPPLCNQAMLFSPY